MAERFNGNTPYRRKTHGSSRRGVFSVPSHDYLLQQQQSKRDLEHLLLALKSKSFVEIIEPEREPAIDEPAHIELGNKNLPTYFYKQDLLDTIAENKATILMGATGSGKSTQLPQYLYEAGYDHVFVLEATRIMADGLSERIQAELSEQLGDAADNLVGKIHGKQRITHADNKITVMTPNTFIRMGAQIRRDFHGKRVAIIPDEIHEDNEHTEVAIGLAGVMTHDEEHFRFIGASATIDPDAIRKPLGRITDRENPNSVHVPVFQVEGRPFDVAIHEAPGMTPAEAYINYGDGHRIAILSTRGEDQIQALRTRIIQKIPGGAADIIFRELMGKTTPQQRTAIEMLARNLPEGKRLVVLASPAGRSGITIPGATFGATDAMINREVLDQDGYKGLQTQYMTQAEIIQVLGRVGRDRPGVGYICDPTPAETRNMRRIEELKALYPFKSMKDRKEYPVPAIFNTNISSMALEIAAIGEEHSLVNLHTLNELDEAVIKNARTRLIRTFGALDRDGKITEIGKLMDKFQVSAELSRGMAEALLNGRSRQHMARVGLIAAAVDVGGVQRFKGNTDGSWKHFIRSGSDDDFIAQLDLMIALVDAEKRHSSTQDRYEFLYENGLDYKRTFDALQSAKKMHRRLGIDTATFEVEPPTYAEVADLREDFTAGMFDSVYRDDGMRGKDRVYTHVRSRENVRHRSISNRSVTEPASGQVIAGIPQHYEEIRKGKIEIKNVLTMTLRVDPKIVGHFALQNGLVEYVPVKNSARIDGGMVREREHIKFGELYIGSREVEKSREVIPTESQRALVEHALNHPGSAQLALRSTAEELAEYRRILPASELEKYRLPQAPADFTKAEIERLLRHYAERTRNAQELDALLGDHAYQKNISVDRYYDAAARAEIIARSPRTIEIAGVVREVYYDKGMPYVTRIDKQQEASITGPIYLDDGREVLRQKRKDSGRGTHRVSFGG